MGVATQGRARYPSLPPTPILRDRMRFVGAAERAVRAPRVLCGVFRRCRTSRLMPARFQEKISELLPSLGGSPAAQFQGWFRIAPAPTDRVSNSMSSLSMARRSAFGVRRKPTLWISHYQVGFTPASMPTVD